MLPHLPAKLLSTLLLVCLAAPLLSACGSGAQASNGAPAAVEAYLNALVKQDANQMANLSCKAWEAQAQTELDSFAAVTLTLDSPKCQAAGTDGDYTLVSCSGKIVANYNGENQEISLSDRTFQALQEGGEWRMCGYH